MINERKIFQLVDGRGKPVMNGDKPVECIVYGRDKGWGGELRIDISPTTNQNFSDIDSHYVGPLTADPRLVGAAIFIAQAFLNEIKKK